MISKEARFIGAQGEELAASLDLPLGKPRAFALFAHCFSCSKDFLASRRIATKLTNFGIGVLRFDFTGLGNSAGDFSNTNFRSNIEDLERAAQYLAENFEAPSLLIGHSLGGAAVLRAANSLPSAKAIVTIGAPADPEHVSKNFAAQIREIERDGQAEVDLGGRSFLIKKHFLDDISGHKIEEAVHGLDAALLILHAPLDDVVGIENAASIFKAAKHPKSFVTLDDADHLIRRERDAQYIAELISSWASRYLHFDEEARAADAPEGVVRVSEIDPSSYTQNILVDGKHQLVADEPKSVGGLDLGPSPFQLLSAALGACTTMTLRMYANRKNLPLDGVFCDVSHDKVHDPSGGKVKLDKFTRTITIIGEKLSASERARMMEIADLCPVHKTLHSDVLIETTLQPPQ